MSYMFTVGSQTGLIAAAMKSSTPKLIASNYVGKHRHTHTDKMLAMRSGLAQFIA